MTPAKAVLLDDKTIGVAPTWERAREIAKRAAPSQKIREVCESPGAFLLSTKQPELRKRAAL